MKIGRVLFVFIVSFFTLFLCEAFSFVAVFGFCTVVPGIEQCGGHNKSGWIAVFALVLGLLLTCFVLARANWRQRDGRRGSRSQSQSIS